MQFTGRESPWPSLSLLTLILDTIAEKEEMWLLRMQQIREQVRELFYEEDTRAAAKSDRELKRRCGIQEKLA
jgi:hypothetical protein